MNIAKIKISGNIISTTQKNMISVLEMVYIFPNVIMNINAQENAGGKNVQYIACGMCQTYMLQERYIPMILIMTKLKKTEV